MKWDKATLQNLLRQYDLRATKALGQHFLMDFNIVHDIADLSGADENAAVVEVGPGLGVLTAALAQRGAKVISLEVDRRLLPILAQTLDDYTQIDIRNQDALKVDYKALADTELQGRVPLFCANLPYNITSPLLTAILTPQCFERVTVMVQREVAQRLTAKADTPAYGAFSVFVQNRVEASIALEVPASCFAPPPKVASAVVVMQRIPLRCGHANFERVVRASFAQRRKQLLNSLSAGLSLPKEQVSEALHACGISPQARGETLTLEDFARLAEAIG